MRTITLNTATVDRHGKWRDAGSELTVGADGNDDADLTTAHADALVDGLRAVPGNASMAEPRKAKPRRATRKKTVKPEPAPASSSALEKTVDMPSEQNA